MSLPPTSDHRHPASGEKFVHDPVNGEIRLSDGRRAAALSEEFIRSLHDDLAQESAAAAPQLLYQCGYEWGLQEMVDLSRLQRAKAGGSAQDLWQLDAKSVLESWWSPLAAAGWGSWTLDLSAQNRGLTFVEIRSSMVATALARASDLAREAPADPTCHLYAGLFAAALSFLERAERHAVEVQCAAQGHPTCRFVVGPGRQIDEAEGWRKQGVTADDIRARLTTAPARVTPPAAKVTAANLFKKPGNK